MGYKPINRHNWILFSNLMLNGHFPAYSRLPVIILAQWVKGQQYILAIYVSPLSLRLLLCNVVYVLRVLMEESILGRASS